MAYELMRTLDLTGRQFATYFVIARFKEDVLPVDSAFRDVLERCRDLCGIATRHEFPHVLTVDLIDPLFA